MRKPFRSRENRFHTVSPQRSDSVILRNDATKVLYPGEFIELKDTSLSSYEGNVSIEPRIDSPLLGSWPSPTISRVIQGVVRIPNDTTEPIYLARSKHFAQVHRASAPSSVEQYTPTSKVIFPTTASSNVKHSHAITIDPDNLLTSSERKAFHDLHLSYDGVFNKVFGTYNGASGPYKASIGLGPVEPPSTKPMLPRYSQSQMQLLQDEADKLVALGVLARPEDLGIEVKCSSPSFLRKKPDDTWRYVTAFNDLGHFTNVPPTIGPTSNDILRCLSSFKYLIKSDLTKAFFQIPLDKKSIPYLGTVTPFRGMYVYTRSAMGQPGASEHLRELLTRVFGDYLREGFLIVKDDDMYIGSNEVSDLLCKWQMVLHRLQQNNLSLSASKTFITPKRTTVLGWIWQSGTISVPPHKIIPLVQSDPPETCSAMRSFIGAYKALSKCIPHYSSLMSPLENCVKGLEGNSRIQWDSDLSTHFRNAQKALDKPQTLTIPTPADKLTMTTDASPVNDGISATLFVTRNGKRLIADNFSPKLKSHQTGWQPCELEALAITAGVKHFSPYIRESEHPLLIFTDSKPCIQAHNKLLRGHFSASARISTFLSCLSEYKVSLSHIKGPENTISDYGSRHPVQCNDSSCQICTFVNELMDSVVRPVNIKDILDGTSRMPFLNKQAWKSAQQECHQLRRTVAHLRAGTRPSRKTRGMRNVKRYLTLCSIDESGLLIVRKPDPYLHQRKLIVVPKDILPGTLHALHLHFTHCTETQLQKLFHRYFYCIGSDNVIKTVVENCHQCTSMKKVPTELFEQSSSASPTTVGQKFAFDVIKRRKQNIFAIRDIHSAYTVASIIPDETGPTLRSVLLSDSSFLRGPTCTIRVDNAPGFISLKGDKLLQSHGLQLEYGNSKNINKNPCAEKYNQELETELLKVDSSGSPVTDSTLQLAIHTLNTRIRNRGLSAKEIITCRDHITGKQLQFSDAELCERQERLREQNHHSSAKSKAPNGVAAVEPAICSGSLVYIKSEGDKFTPRDLYMIVNISGKIATLQKFRGQSFMSKKYSVPLNKLYAMTPGLSITPTAVEHSDASDYDVDDEDDDDDDDDFLPLQETVPIAINDDNASTDEEVREDTPPSRQSTRSTRPIDRFGEWGQLEELEELEE